MRFYLYALRVFGKAKSGKGRVAIIRWNGVIRAERILERRRGLAGERPLAHAWMQRRAHRSRQIRRHQKAKATVEVCVPVPKGFIHAGDRLGWNGLCGTIAG